MRYYSTQRPVSPGSYPTGVVISIVNFDTKRYVHEIGGNAWGYIEYGIELSTEDAHAYELVPAPMPPSRPEAPRITSTRS